MCTLFELSWQTSNGSGAIYAIQGIVNWSEWLEILKQYGPVVGVLLAFIYAQARWINKLLDRHERAYSGEIERMNQHMTLLLEHVLGKQPTSQNMPTVKELKNNTKKPKEREEQ